MSPVSANTQAVMELHQQIIDLINSPADAATPIETRHRQALTALAVSQAGIIMMLAKDNRLTTIGLTQSVLKTLAEIMSDQIKLMDPPVSPLPEVVPANVTVLHPNRRRVH